ncbi:MAG: polysaccharide deacetylase [Lachnospiraceae bacterium]|nr:polysaccharide deacetylase [Lachnospiraceae bacterium]
MSFEDDYERRRAYVSRRRQQRKRQRMVRILTALILFVTLITIAGTGILYFRHQNNTPEVPGSEPSEEPSSLALNSSESTTEDEPETTVASVQQIEELLKEAESLAFTYDYDGAIELLTSSELSGDPAVKETVSSYEEIRSTLVRAEPSEVTHVFFHSIIMDNRKAFDGDSDEKGYNQVMTTKSEFLKILEQMYERGYVLVKLHDIAHEETDEHGSRKFVAGNIMLPPGKKPFVMSQDDVCYYEYMDGDGFASRIIIGEDGKPTCEMKMDDGSISVGSYDLVPLLEDFITEHPDFSYRGARAVLAFTGYQGVLGYRTDPEYKNSNPNYEADCEAVRRVAQCLRDNGWELASHSWGHINLANRDYASVKTDAEKWENRVESLIGETDIILYPFGADVGNWRPYSRDNDKFALLYDLGFRYFCNVDSSQHWVQIGDTYMRQGRRNLDGYRMYYDLPETNPTKTYLSDLFDVSTVFDRERPTPVAPMK